MTAKTDILFGDLLALLKSRHDIKGDPDDGAAWEHDAETLVELIDAELSSDAPEPSVGGLLPYIDIVFDGPPGPTAGRFVGVEDPSGRSIRVGEWVESGDGFRRLRIYRRPPDEQANAELVTCKCAAPGEEFTISKRGCGEGVCHAVPAPVEQVPDPDAETIQAHVDFGHSERCAKRMVWGDGVCTCGLGMLPDEAAPADDCVDVPVWVFVRTQQRQMVDGAGRWVGGAEPPTVNQAKDWADVDEPDRVLRATIRVPRKYLTQPEPVDLPAVVATEDGGE